DSGEMGDLLIVDRGGGVAAAEHRLLGSAEAGPTALEPVGLARLIGRCRIELALEMIDIVVRRFPGPRRVDDAYADQWLGDDCRRSRAGSVPGCPWRRRRDKARIGRTAGWW